MGCNEGRHVISKLSRPDPTGLGRVKFFPRREQVENPLFEIRELYRTNCTYRNKWTPELGMVYQI